MAKRAGKEPKSKTEATVPTFGTFEAVYCGRRISKQDKLAHFWKRDFEEGMRGYDKQIAPALIGERWKFSLANKEGSVYTGGPARAVKVIDTVDNEETRGWVASDIAHAGEFETERLSRKLAKRQTQFQEALLPLRRMLDTLPTHTERAHFVARVTAELWRRS